MLQIWPFFACCQPRKKYF